MAVPKEQRINSEHHHSAMVKLDSSENAKRWFKRKPYAAVDLRKGGSIEQNKTESIPVAVP